MGQNEITFEPADVLVARNEHEPHAFPRHQSIYRLGFARRRKRFLITLADYATQKIQGVVELHPPKPISASTAGTSSRQAMICRRRSVSL
jgi:hypothetical protein